MGSQMGLGGDLTVSRYSRPIIGSRMVNLAQFSPSKRIFLW